MTRTILLPITSLGALLLAACAAPGGASSAGGSVAESSVSGGGIQTSSIRAAPAARQAANESRPLSELDTPEAIAAREAAARSAPPRPAAAVAAPAAAAPSATAATEAAPSAHQQNTALQKGATVRARSGALLHARPSVSGDTVPAPAAADLVLGPQIYNAGGYWWYVTAGKDAGWLLQSDIQR